MALFGRERTLLPKMLFVILSPRTQKASTQTQTSGILYLIQIRSYGIEATEIVKSQVLFMHQKRNEEFLVGR